MLDKSFQETSNIIKNEIQRTQLEIMMDANNKLVNLYYNIGKIIHDNFSWGNKFVKYLATDLKISFPNLKGFSERNLNYMKTFYEEYMNDSEILHLGAKLPWKHNLELIKKVNNKEIRKWYMEKCLEEGWSKSILNYQIDTNLYQRQVKSTKQNNFKLTMDKNSDLADNYNERTICF